MDKIQASNIVKNTFEKPFDKTVFISFVKNLLNQIEEAPFTYKGNYIHDSFKEYISSLERIGKYSDGEYKIDILIVQLKKDTSIERARTMQRNYIAKYLNGSRGGEMKDAALVAFVSPNTEDWRFSLVRMDYKFEKSAKGKTKVKEQFTPARRWSFLVGTHENSHTAQSRLVPLISDDTQNPSLAELEESFNIEKVTKEFFEKYRELFLRTKEELDKVIKNDSVIKTDFDKKGVNTVDFSKKLLGQIVFLYFLQKKGWFGVQRDSEWGTGSKQFLRELFEKKHGSYNNFFNDILEPLFYEALRIDRSHDDHYYSRFNCKIPFLNGGLFDPMNGYDWVKTDILIPNELFSNSKKTKEGDTGDGILDIFDRYNFTVKEDEPLEKEVAIDPELLGKAYEKFNAIRPDNYAEFKKALKSGKKGDESKFNKQYGVYYTPREIVHYMCQQSLINYLYTELNDGIVTYEKLGDDQTDMFGNEGKTGQLDLTIEHNSKPSTPKEDIETLIHFGEHVSENEAHVEKAGKETDTYYYKIPDSIRNNSENIDNKLANIKVCDPAIGSGAFPVGMMSEIVRARNALTPFIKDKDRSVYNFKRECIENSLYGVDIDPGAVEIAKLRLWLSLVVDENDIKQIKPLPNLDYKIVCGNSLIGFPESIAIYPGEKLIIDLQHKYFNETNPTRKNEIKKQIDDTINIRYKTSLKTFGYQINFDFKTVFADVFNTNKGFDVVIANPPYIDSENMVNQGQSDIRKIISKTYKYTKGNWDIYIAFFEKGFSILSSKGVLTFITPDKWISKPFGNELRANKYYNLSILLKAGRDIFEDAKVDAIVTLFVTRKVDFTSVLEIIDSKIEFKHKFKKNILKEPYALDPLFSDSFSIIMNLSKGKKTFQDIGLECENSCATSDAYNLKPLISNLPTKDSFDKNILYKVVNTGTIGKFYSKWGKSEMTYLGGKYLYPIVNKNAFTKTFNKSYTDRAKKKKLIVKGLNLLDAFLDEKGEYIPGKTTLIIFQKNNDSKYLKIALGILSSNLIHFYIKEKYSSYSYNQGISFTRDMLNNLPYPDISSSDEKTIIDFVEKLSKKFDDNTYEKLNNKIYDIYCLSDEKKIFISQYNK